jgi:hypothetical protein
MMLGWSAGDFVSSSWDALDAEVSDTEQLAAKRRKTARHTRIPKSALLRAPKDLSTLLVTMEPSPLFLFDCFRANHGNAKTLKEA